MTALATNPEIFFNHIDSFIDYRQTVYEVSEQTTGSNIIDINLFRRYVNGQHFKEITGQVVMGFQVYLKRQRYINKLVETGVIRFQKGYRKKPCIELTEVLVT